MSLTLLVSHGSSIGRDCRGSTLRPTGKYSCPDVRVIQKTNDEQSTSGKQASIYCPNRYRRCGYDQVDAEKPRQPEKNRPIGNVESLLYIWRYLWPQAPDQYQ